MKHSPTLVVAISLTMSLSACVHAAAQPAIELRPDAPQCRMPKAKLPKLGVDFAYDVPTEIKADFNGDGWCDYVLAVPYPLNSKMNSYDLNEMMALGQASGWKPVFNGKKGWELEEKGYEHETWPRFRVDLTDIRLVFPKQHSAPFVLGLDAGMSDEGKRNMGDGCLQYQSVHRWDNAAGTFKKSDDATRDAVLKYFYSVIEKPCRHGNSSEGNGKGNLSVRSLPATLARTASGSVAQRAVLLAGTGLDQATLDHSRGGETNVTNSRGQKTVFRHTVTLSGYRLLEVGGAGCAGCGETNGR